MNGGKMNDDIRWYKFTVPAEHQNQWLSISVKSVEDGFNMLVYDSLGKKYPASQSGKINHVQKDLKLKEEIAEIRLDYPWMKRTI